MKKRKEFKTKEKVGLIFMTLIIILMPLCAFGQDYSEYFTFKVGQYSPTGDLDDAGFGSVFIGELSFGAYISENFSFEISGGSFKTDETFTYFVSGIGPVSEKDEIKILPFLFTLKGHIPLKAAEIYGGLGVGLYFASIDIDIHTPVGPLYFSDDDNVFGYHFLAGVNFNITEKWFLGIEAKKFITNDFSFYDTDQGVTLYGDIDLDGYTISGQVGYRF